jgi:ATP-binding cassette subfamily B (MDR/TAP) protein 1
MFIQGISQAFAGPLLAVERSQTATAATLVDRAISVIATVKAFNAAPHEQSALSTVLNRMNTAGRRLNALWGLTSGLAQFVMLGMFVQGFWFGAKLVKEGNVSAGDVMAVFWAYLIATSNTQMCIP